MNNLNNKNLKFALIHHLLLGKCKGGGEKLMLQTANHFDADFITGSIELNAWDPGLVQDSFTQYMHPGKWDYLGEESQNKIFKYIKRQLDFIFSNKIETIAKSKDVVIVQFGNIAFVPQRIKKYNPNCKTIAYVNTPPRGFTDQFESNLNSLTGLKKIFLSPFYHIFRWIVMYNFTNAVKACDHVIANSENIKRRIEKYTGIVADSVIFPLVETSQFNPNLPSQNFFLSHGRLEKLKRIELIVKAFQQIPDQQLVITSGGPLEGWVKSYIKDNNITNINFKGRVSDEERGTLMATCKAGIYIPIDEDAGITQLEFMACGKPVLGVKDGGLIESIIDGETGILMSKEPTIEELIDNVRSLTIEKAISMKEACVIQSKKFDESVYFQKFDDVVNSLT